MARRSSGSRGKFVENNKGQRFQKGTVVENMQGYRGIVRKVEADPEGVSRGYPHGLAKAEVVYSKAQQHRKFFREGSRTSPETPAELRGKGFVSVEYVDHLKVVGKAKRVPRIHTSEKATMYGSGSHVEGVFHGKGKAPRRKKIGGTLVANLGDRDPFSYGGYLVFREKGSYDGVYWDEPSSESDSAKVEVYRFIVPKDVFKEYDWAKPEDIASYVGASVDEIERDGKSRDVKVRAQVVRDIGSYHGFENLDEYSNTWTVRELKSRYGRAVDGLYRRKRSR